MSRFAGIQFVIKFFCLSILFVTSVVLFAEGLPNQQSSLLLASDSTPVSSTAVPSTSTSGPAQDGVITPGSNLPVALAPFFQNFIASKTLDPYFSVDANDYFNQESEKNPISADQYFKTALFFTCPGHSVLTGIISTFNKEKDAGQYTLGVGVAEKHKIIPDRRFRFVCSYLENYKGEQLRKTQCNEPTLKQIAPPIPGDIHPFVEFDEKHPYVTQLRKPVVKTCEPGKFMDSYFSLYEQKASDRYSDVRCCKMKDWDETLIEKGACQKAENVNSLGQDFQFLCPTDAVLTEISSTYAPMTGTDPDPIDYKIAQSPGDRVFSFTCCKGGAPYPKP